jgi:hypothetical protein
VRAAAARRGRHDREAHRYAVSWRTPAVALLVVTGLSTVDVGRAVGVGPWWGSPLSLEGRNEPTTPPSSDPGSERHASEQALLARLNGFAVTDLPDDADLGLLPRTGMVTGNHAVVVAGGDDRAVVVLVPPKPGRSADSASRSLAGRTGALRGPGQHPEVYRVSTVDGAVTFAEDDGWIVLISGPADLADAIVDPILDPST